MERQVGKHLVDQMNDYYTTRAKTNRWALLSFYYMLDTIRVNSKTLWCLKHKKTLNKTSTFEVGFELANALAMPFIQQRKVNGLRKPTLKKIDYVLDKAGDTPKAAIEKRHERHGDRKRCRICLKNCVSKAEKSNMKRPTQQCQCCGECICDDHSICVCDNCNAK